MHIPADAVVMGIVPVSDYWIVCLSDDEAPVPWVVQADYRVFWRCQCSGNSALAHLSTDVVACDEEDGSMVASDSHHFLVGVFRGPTKAEALTKAEPFLPGAREELLRERAARKVVSHQVGN